jgi:hypothetical protein
MFVRVQHDYSTADWEPSSHTQRIPPCCLLWQSVRQHERQSIDRNGNLSLPEVGAAAHLRSRRALFNTRFVSIHRAEATLEWLVSADSVARRLVVRPESAAVTTERLLLIQALHPTRLVSIVQFRLATFYTAFASVFRQWQL